MVWLSVCIWFQKRYYLSLKKKTEINYNKTTNEQEQKLGYRGYHYIEI